MEDNRGKYVFMLMGYDEKGRRCHFFVQNVSPVPENIVNSPKESIVERVREAARIKKEEERDDILR